MTDQNTDPAIEVHEFEISLAGNWWAFVIRGIVALALAVLAWLMPTEAVLALTIVFGAFAFVDGIFGIVAAVRNIRQGESWGWLALSGALGILTGLVVLIAPFVATLVLAVFLWTSIAVWSLLSGVFEVMAAVRLRKLIEGEFWLGLSGVISIVLGVVIVWFLFTKPAESLLALGWLLGVYAAMFGIVMILLGLKLRKLSSES